MAKRPAKATPPPTPRSTSPEKGIELLRQQLDKGQHLLASRPLSSSSHGTWENVTRDYLVKAFGSDSPHVSAVLDIGKRGWGSFPLGANEEWWENRRAQILGDQLKMIESVIELLQTEIELASPSTPMAEPQTLGNRVFIAHGREEAALHQVARFLEKLRLSVTVLREQPNEGRTIIEKFVDYSDVAFAVVLLTQDDRGGPADATAEGLMPRARQNVILELGFFLGKLGRKRVCALYQEGVEVPSDYSGVLFVPLDANGAWRFDLARELKAAGLDVDMNRAV